MAQASGDDHLHQSSGHAEADEDDTKNVSNAAASKMSNKGDVDNHQQDKDGDDDQDDDDDQEEQGTLDGMRILFERSEPTMRRRHKVSVEKDVWETIRVVSAKDPSGSGSSLQSGVYLWPACKSLAKHLSLQTFPQLFSIRTSASTSGSSCKSITVLELGAGAGLSGLGAAACLRYRNHALKESFNWRIVLTDRDPHLMKMMNRSIVLNSFEENVVTRELSWAKTNAEAEIIVKKFIDELRRASLLADDSLLLVIGSDVIYSSESAMEVGFMLSQFLLQHPRSICILSSSFRHPETTTILAGACSKVVGDSGAAKGSAPRKVRMTNLVDDLENEGLPSLIEEIVLE